MFYAEKDVRNYAQAIVINNYLQTKLCVLSKVYDLK